MLCLIFNSKPTSDCRKRLMAKFVGTMAILQRTIEKQNTRKHKWFASFVCARCLFHFFDNSFSGLILLRDPCLAFGRNSQTVS